MSEVMVIACYKPKPGMHEALLEEVKNHLPTLRSEGLASEGPSLTGRAKDGTIVEVFCWKSQAAIDAAHENNAVSDMWARFGNLCDYCAIRDVEGAGDLFTALEPI